MGIIVAFDIGIASVGWAVVCRETEEVIESGVNIFPEATAAQNLTRRQMRQTKRGKRRQRTRLDDFVKLWKQTGFLANSCFSTNLVDLKVKALQEKLTEEELFAVLYSYLKHRGISYLEDADDGSTGNTSSYARGLALNQEELKTKYPCQIQKERLEQYGKYRGMNDVISEQGELLSLSNVFTISAYRNEIIAVLAKQKQFHSLINDEFCDQYLVIFNRKRKYYEGPGNEQSRTDYGIYTTRKDPDTGDYITEQNIFEKLIGKCSVYPEELRASAASFTAQEFNVLNDLNNLTINGRKLEPDEKKEIVKTLLVSDTINMRKIITNVIKEPIEELTGARIDKDEKEQFHTFKPYNKLRKELRKISYDITQLGREELDIIGYILTINTDKESILNALKDSGIELSEEVKECLIQTRKGNGDLFNRWHSFSLKIMNELIPEMYEQAKEQMTLLTELELVTSDKEIFQGCKYIPVDACSENLLNPVVKRAVRITTRVLNALLKEYEKIEEVVIEMPRDRNSDEEKKRITDSQKLNEKELEFVENKIYTMYGRRMVKSDYSSQKQLTLKLKLWNEQDGFCAYSGRPISALDIIEHPETFEIDHIIPRSISFDDSRNNKVLVYRTENQKKGNHTPYFYLTHIGGNQTYEEYKAKVMECYKKKEYRYSRAKVHNLLFEQDITKMEVLQGFINRNLNDTRYASRVVLNTFQNFFKAKEMDTKVKVIRGSFTHQMRVNMKLDKNRDETFTHHAVDAMLIAYSQMGYEAYHKLQGTFIDFETGEILDERMWNQNMSDDVYQDYLYGSKWANIRNNIIRKEKETKFWYYVDKKSNRGLCNQTIRGTKQYDGKTMKINKFDIRTKDGCALFKKLAIEDGKKEPQKEKLLVYRNDPKTFENLVQIYKEYQDAANPFLQYEKETGDVVRKYAKKHNGPRIDKLKYLDGEIGSCIDISHKFGHEKGSKKVVLESLVPYRMDVYFSEKDKIYRFVGIKQSDIKCEKGKYVIDEEAYAIRLLQEKMITEGQTRVDLAKNGYEFRLSFYKNDVIEYEKDGEVYRRRFLSRREPEKRNFIELKPLEKEKYEPRMRIGITKTSSVKKVNMDILGNVFVQEKEKFSKYC